MNKQKRQARKSNYLFWFGMKHQANFGDSLSPYIISNLSGFQVKAIKIPDKNIGKIRFVYTQLKLFIRGQLSKKDFLAVIRGFFLKNYLVSTGSILEFNFSKKAKIWGSGLINKKGLINKAEFHAVRGQYSLKALAAFGIDELVLGDPALLLPIIYTARQKPDNSIGIIPHIIHQKFAQANYDINEILLIDLKRNDIEEVIKEINSCRYNFSSSLHGLIVSHAYGIPCLWVKFPGELYGDNIKFPDYFSSVGIPEYKALNIEKMDVVALTRLMDEQADNALPKKDLPTICQSLLNSAPFLLDSKYEQLKFQDIQLIFNRS